MGLAMPVNRKTIFSAAMAFILLLSVNGVLLAGISVEPVRHTVSIMPGQEQVVMYHVNNSGDEDVDITIEPKAWSGLKDTYEWLSLESENIYVKAGESTPFIVKLNVPEGAEGEMVAMLFLCYKDSIESQLNIRNGIPLYMIIEGTESYKLDIKDIDVSYARKVDFYDLTFLVKIKNTGNVHIVPDIQVVIENDTGRVLNTISLIRPNIVLREKDHTYQLTWREPELRDGIYKAIIELNYEDKIEPRTKEIRFQVAGDRFEKIEI